MNGFGARVRQYRKARGITQKALAEAVALTPTYYNRIEQGTRKIPKVETVLALVAALHLPPEEAEELVQLAGYSPEVLQRGGGVAQPIPSMGRTPQFQPLPLLAAVERQKQWQAFVSHQLDVLKDEVAELKEVVKELNSTLRQIVLSPLPQQVAEGVEELLRLVREQQAYRTAPARPEDAAGLLRAARVHQITGRWEGYGQQKLPTGKR
jgi:transcriptional regulator with XRE-family HTH domain